MKNSKTFNRFYTNKRPGGLSPGILLLCRFGLVVLTSLGLFIDLGWDNLNATTGGLDLLAGTGRELMRMYRQSTIDLTIAQHLNQTLALGWSHKTMLHQR